jgi:ribosomal protein S18 acetylase RimI-like enzyme
MSTGSPTSERPRHRIRPARPDDAEAVARIAVDSGLFAVEEMEAFEFDPERGDGHTWVVLVDDGGAPIGAAYYAPEPFADRMWNLYFIAVLREHQGGGTGTALIEHVEDALRRAGEDVARTLIVETSSLDRFAATREFYRRRGFDEEARIRDVYGPGDDKVVFWKRVHAGT